MSQKRDLAFWKKRAASLGIPIDEIIAELRKEIIDAIRPELPTAGIDTEGIALKAANMIKDTLPNLQQMSEEVESALAKRILASMQTLQENVMTAVENTKQDFVGRVTKLEQNLPAVAQPFIEQFLATKLQGIAAQMGEEFRERLKEELKANPGAPAGGAGGLINTLLSADNLPSVIELVKIFKPQNNPQQELASVFKTFITGMQFGTKIKSGQVDIKDLESIPGIAGGTPTD